MEVMEGFKRYVDVVVEWIRFSGGVGNDVLMVEFDDFNGFFNGFFQPKYLYDSMILFGK